MNKITVAVVSCIFVTTLVTTTGGQQNDVLERLKKDPDFVTVGQIGNKVFIRHKNSINWMGARHTCKEAGLELAVIRNDREFRFVSDELYKTRTAAWVSGIMNGVEHDKNTAFVWDTDGTPIGDDVSFVLLSKTWLCMYYSGDDHIYADSCINGRHETLCQQLLQ